MSFEAKIYASDGVSLVYNLGPMLQRYTSGWPNDENPQSVSLTNLRSQGEIVIPGGDGPSEITIGVRITGTDYADLISTFNTLQSTIAKNTRYYLKIQTSVSTTDDLKVMRKGNITIENTNWVSWMHLSITFTKNSWS